LSLILIDDVLEVNLVKIVGPRMQDLEAFVLHVLCAVSLDVSLDEFIAGLEGDNRVLEVILFNRSLCVLQEVRDSLDA
jgi:hypothetical protein